MVKTVPDAGNKQKNLFSFFSKKTASSSPPSAGAAASTTASAASLSNNNSSAAVSKPYTTTASSNNTISSASAVRQHKRQLSQLTIGTKLAIYWPDDDEYYPCTIRIQRKNHPPSHPGYVFELHYDDGEVETVDLSRERFKIVGGNKKRIATTTSGSEDEEDDSDDEEERVTINKSSGDTKKKRRRILEESEEDEFESSSSDYGDGEDSESEYKAAESMDDDDSLDVGNVKDDWIESDDDNNDSDDEPLIKKKKKKASVTTTATIKKVTITKVGGGSTTNDIDDGEKTTRKFVSPTPQRGVGGIGSGNNKTTQQGATKQNEIDFSSFLSQSHSDESPKRPPTTSVNAAPSSRSLSAASSASAVSQSQHSPIPVKQQTSGHSPMPAIIPKPIPDIVNMPGSHMHNHLKFFTTDRKDANRNPISHPNYSNRTLHVNYDELDKSNGTDANGKYKKTSPAQKQWWEIKSQYADTVLLFKTGKFYEMFHDDADVGAKVLGHVYMKGIIGHTGFPEAAYGTMVYKLVEAGYKVARVEQTETPAALAERKKSMKGGKKPEVVCREVCSVVSKGTRTFCYLDDVTLLEKGEASTGPLIVIKEVLVEDDADMMTNKNEEGMDVDNNDQDEDSGTRAVCEYGVTIVDAVTGVVTLGQFADDVLRSRMQTLLARFGPSEVSEEYIKPRAIVSHSP
jgi:DNA mismatch repair protein MSH6